MDDGRLVIHSAKVAGTSPRTVSEGRRRSFAKAGKGQMAMYDEANERWNAELERFIEGAPFAREDPDGIRTHLSGSHVPDYWPDQLKQALATWRSGLITGRCEECGSSVDMGDEHRESCSGHIVRVAALARQLGFNLREAFG